MTPWHGLPVLLVIFIALIVTGRSGERWASCNSPHCNHFSGPDGIIIALSQLVIVSQLLGLTGHLTSSWLLVTHIVISLCVHRALRRALRRAPQRIESDVDPVIPKDPAAALSILQRAIIILPFTAGLAALIAAATQAPGGTDVWTYHLAFPAEWCTWHDLRCSVQHIGDPGPPFYPHHSGLLAHLLMAPLHSDILGRFHQVPMFFAGWIALVAGMRTLGISRTSAHATASLAALIPLAVSWLPLAFADISLAGAIALVFYASARLNKTSARRRFFILGLATGLAAGFKAFGLYYALPIVPWGLYRGLWSCVKPGPAKLACLFAWSIGTFLTGAFWPLRNWILNANPFFPYQIEFLNTVVFPGLYGRSQVIQHGFHQFAFMGQFQPSELWKTLSAPGFVLIICMLLNLVTTFRPKQFRWIYVIPAIMMIQFLYLPYRHHPRLLLPAFWMCAPAAAALIDRAAALIDRAGAFRKSKWFNPKTLVAILLASAFLSTNYVVFKTWHVMLVTGLIVWVAGRVWMPVGLKQERISVACSRSAYVRPVERGPFERSIWIISAAFFLIVSLIFPFICHNYERTKWSDQTHELGEIANWLVELNVNYPNLNIAFTGFNTPYPLFGPHLSNSVRFIPRDGDPTASWTGNVPYVPIHREPDFKAWRQQVDHAGIDLIVIATIPGDSLPPEYEWVRSMNDFELGYLTRVYQVWRRYH